MLLGERSFCKRTGLKVRTTLKQAHPWKSALLLTREEQECTFYLVIIRRLTINVNLSGTRYYFEVWCQ